MIGAGSIAGADSATGEGRTGAGCAGVSSSAAIFFRVVRFAAGSFAGFAAFAGAFLAVVVLVVLVVMLAAFFFAAFFFGACSSSSSGSVFLLMEI